MKRKKMMKKKKKEVEPEVIYIPPKSYKIIGYCPKCGMILSKKDFISKMIFVCPCGVRKHKRFLKKESSNVKISSKKEYLKDAKSNSKQMETHHKDQLETIVDLSNLSDIPIVTDI